MWKSKKGMRESEKKMFFLVERASLPSSSFNIKEFTIRQFCDAVAKGSPLCMRLWCRDNVG